MLNLPPATFQTHLNMAIVFSRVIAALLLSCVGIVYGHGGGLEYYINGVLHPSYVTNRTYSSSLLNNVLKKFV